MNTYKSRAAQEAQASGYGSQSYWDYLDEHALELHDRCLSYRDTKGAAHILTRTLAESLTGNESN